MQFTFRQIFYLNTFFNPSGHEACFVMLLLCLYKINILTNDDFVAIINRIFERFVIVGTIIFVIQLLTTKFCLFKVYETL